jgi:hypothetical protein
MHHQQQQQSSLSLAAGSAASPATDPVYLPYLSKQTLAGLQIAVAFVISVCPS